MYVMKSCSAIPADRAECATGLSCKYRSSDHCELLAELITPENNPTRVAAIDRV